MKKAFVWSLIALSALFARAEIQIIDGVKYECKDGMCMPVEDDAPVAAPSDARLAQGYMSADEFVAFLENRPAESALAGKSIFLVLILVLVGGFLMNLTPCVFPMIPINLMIIGKSAKRGLAYGAGIALAYGALGVAAAVGGMAFGTIQASPYFNSVVALVFVALGLSLCGVWFLDFSKYRFRTGAFLMGVLSAILAGACVAPILISVLLLTSDLFAKGEVLALALPFVLGIGMALPWPFLGAGMQVLPKPGAWMKWVNKFFALVVFGFAVWYGNLAVRGFMRERVEMDGAEGSCTPATFASKLAEAKKPVIVDCWASWCKNCGAMEREVLSDEKVKAALKRFTVIKLQAENIKELRSLSGFEAVKGLPAFVIFE